MVVVSNPQITYAPRDDTSTAVEVATLANIYALALQKHKDKNEATRPGSPDDAKGPKDDRAEISIHN